MKDMIKKALNSGIKVKELLLADKYLDTIQKIADMLISAVDKKGKIIVFGNGGSAADAQHMACELVGRFKKERKAIPAISLTTNTSSITAIANDYSYDVSFSRQLEALAGQNDVAVCISTSGRAKNVLEAVKKAKALKVTTVALTGKDGGELAGMADISLIVPSEDTPIIQEAHITVIHILCALIEEKMS